MEVFCWPVIMGVHNLMMVFRLESKIDKHRLVQNWEIPSKITTLHHFHGKIVRQTIRFGHDGTSDCRRPDDLQQELAKAIKTWGCYGIFHQDIKTIVMSFMCHHYVSKCVKMLETSLKWFNS